VKALVLAAALAAAPQLARADGWIKCHHPDDHGNCNASGSDSASVGSGLLLMGVVAYGIARRKRR
jgi:MYXO-CTERM domain-containing protein